MIDFQIKLQVDNNKYFSRLSMDSKNDILTNKMLALVLNRIADKLSSNKSRINRVKKI